MRTAPLDHHTGLSVCVHGDSLALRWDEHVALGQLRPHTTGNLGPHVATAAHFSSKVALRHLAARCHMDRSNWPARTHFWVPLCVGQGLRP